MSPKYDHQTIEPKWQKAWEDAQLFQDSAKGEVKDPLYLLFAFAYPSGSGLHVGHVESKTALDILARYNRMKGKDVFFPVGWDAFGLPAENYAVKTGTPPAVTTKNAIDTFRRQIKRIGISYDWANEIATSHPEYYKWTQWLFLQLYNKGLAYKAPGLVNWCPSCQTVLANEQVVDGKCERCGTEVTQKDLNQWYFKITDYADELISGLDQVDWPKPTKLQQLHWIGKSQGVTYKQKVKELGIELEAYDSVPQTFMAQTFCVIAPENPKLVELVKGTEHEKPVMEFVEEFKKRKIQNRFQIDKEIEGVFTGRYIENPFGTGDLPIWVATFVIADYGSGFVNCSAHDERDFAFAKKYNISLRPVMFPADPAEAEKVRNLEVCYHHAPEGVLELPEEFAGQKWGEVRSGIIEHIEKKGFGKATSQYKLRDWLISRQRYWGAPIPVVYDPEGKAHPVKEEHLPWILPTDVEFKPTGESPLVHSKEFIERTERLYGKGWRPEFDTMDTFVDSSWYYLRYPSARSEQVAFEKEQLEKWLPVDFYMIGPEHIVLHLLYSRFFTKFLRDEGYLNFDEPFMKMRHQGMILGPDHRKMSKSKGNVIDPDGVITDYGADTLRVYEMFMGPIEADKPWSTTSVIGVFRFLNRMYDLVSGAESQGETVKELGVKLHETIKRVTDDIPALKFNTAIAGFMELLNIWEAQAEPRKAMSGDDLQKLIKILAPFAPFMAEELWDQLGRGVSQYARTDGSIHLQEWPEYDQALVSSKPVLIMVQVNGKLRSSLEIAQDLYASWQNPQAELEALAKNDAKVQKWLGGADIRKVIYVPPKERAQGLINFVVA